MAQKKMQWQIKGMNRDLAPSKFNPEFAFENMNLRIITNSDNTLYSLVNEKGPLDTGVTIQGIPIGYAELNNKIILFTTEVNLITLEDREGEYILRGNTTTSAINESGTAEIINYNQTSENSGEAVLTLNDKRIFVFNVEFFDASTQMKIDYEVVRRKSWDCPPDIYRKEPFDHIYKIELENQNIKLSELYTGDLKFSVDYPIETQVYYENEDVQKVYWVDGKNQPRMMNIMHIKNAENDDTQFDFNTPIELQHTIIIEKLPGGGIFPPGTIQYCFSYYNKNGQQSNIFEQTALYYLAYKERGGKADETVGCSFKIELTNVDHSYDFIRVYSIIRTSENATPSVNKVCDLETSGDTEDTNIIFVDNNTTYEAVDPTELLYIGGEDIIAGTICQKDNTLFLGNIEMQKRDIGTIEVTIDSHKQSLKDYIRSKADSLSIGEDLKAIERETDEDFYNYNPNNNLSSYYAKNFKTGETYRFGLIAQHITGKWSEVLWITDKKIGQNASLSERKGCIVNFEVDEPIKNALIANDYVRVAPVVVLPSDSDRDIICQGFINPTLFNIADRASGQLFSQSDWMIRRNVIDDGHYRSLSAPLTNSAFGNKYCEVQGSEYYLRSLKIDGLHFSSFSTTPFQNLSVVNTSEDKIRQQLLDNGTYKNFTFTIHSIEPPKYNDSGQTVSFSTNTVISSDGWGPLNAAQFTSNFGNLYIHDWSILTFHTPEIECTDTLLESALEDCKLRYVGYINIKKQKVDISVTTSTIGESLKSEFIKKPVSDSLLATKKWLGGNLWWDTASSLSDSGSNKDLLWSFMIYPWQKTGSLSDDNNSLLSTVKDEQIVNRTLRGQLKQKKISSFMYGISSFLGTAITDNCDIHTPKIWRSDSLSAIKIKNTAGQDVIYQGNIDKVVTPITSNMSNWLFRYKESRVVSDYFSGKDLSQGYPLYVKSTPIYVGATKKFIQIAGGSTYEQSNSDTTFPLVPWVYQGIEEVQEQLKFKDFKKIYANDPVHIKYKSSPHIVISMKGKQADGSVCQPLPPLNNIINTDSSATHFWQEDSFDEFSAFLRPTTLCGSDILIAELYRDRSNYNRFGGTSDEALASNQWIRCGEAITLNSTNKLEFLEGDTYIARYDCLKTYPFTLEDENSLVQIMSANLETRVNLDARVDINRGQASNLVAMPTNYNLFNTAYQQNNNFFEYRTKNYNFNNTTKWNNSLTWSLTKTPGADIDLWTSISLGSSLDLDGDKGKLNALRRVNNNIIAFQDTGISQILYNENAQITTTAGVPIEIGNSGKVEGKRYISDKVGCQNKWSICETPLGLYFIDNLSKGIYTFNQQLNNLSTPKGFYSWISENSQSTEPWNPVNPFNNFVTYYDKINQDILFINKDTCLAYSEIIGNFTSFYNYENVPYLINLQDRAFWINKSVDNTSYKLWMHNEGTYNKFFDVTRPYFITLVANDNPTIDKVFDGIEFRGDVVNENNKLIYDTSSPTPNRKPFDTVRLWNEYQDTGNQDLQNVRGKSSNLRQKFRMWRINNFRCVWKTGGIVKHDRIRNPWTYITLSNNKPTTDKTVLHDVQCFYTY